MFYPSVLAALFTTLGLASAVAIEPRNIHVADFRGFGATKCYEENLGVWTVIDEDVDNERCKDFAGNNVHSLRLSNILDKCQSKFASNQIKEKKVWLNGVVYLYEDDACTIGRRQVVPGTCYDAENQWKAWNMACDL